MKKNLLVISDGNGVETDFEKWPRLLGILLSQNFNIINRSQIGASNEFILLQLAEALEHNHIDHAIIQWTTAQRLDLLIDDFWHEQRKQDPKYSFNTATSNGQDWWITSGSHNSYIREYHTRYIKPWQADQRTYSTMLSGAKLLESKNIDYKFSLCYDFEFKGNFDGTLRSLPWIWHKPNKGITDFVNVSQYKSYDQGLSNVHPLVALDWINNVLRSQCDFVDYSDKTFYNLVTAIEKKCSK
jgi:hypothetical protein